MLESEPRRFCAFCKSFKSIALVLFWWRSGYRFRLEKKEQNRAIVTTECLCLQWEMQEKLWSNCTVIFRSLYSLGQGLGVSTDVSWELGTKSSPSLCTSFPSPLWWPRSSHTFRECCQFPMHVHYGLWNNYIPHVESTSVGLLYLTDQATTLSCSSTCRQHRTSSQSVKHANPPRSHTITISSPDTPTIVPVKTVRYWSGKQPPRLRPPATCLSQLTSVCPAGRSMELAIKAELKTVLSSLRASKAALRRNGACSLICLRRLVISFNIQHVCRTSQSVITLTACQLCCERRYREHGSASHTLLTYAATTTVNGRNGLDLTKCTWSLSL